MAFINFHGIVINTEHVLYARVNNEMNNVYFIIHFTTGTNLKWCNMTNDEADEHLKEWMIAIA